MASRIICNWTICLTGFTLSPLGSSVDYPCKGRDMMRAFARGHQSKNYYPLLESGPLRGPVLRGIAGPDSKQHLRGSGTNSFYLEITDYLTNYSGLTMGKLSFWHLCNIPQAICYFYLIVFRIVRL